MEKIGWSVTVQIKITENKKANNYETPYKKKINIRMYKTSHICMRKQTYRKTTLNVDKRIEENKLKITRIKTIVLEFRFNN